MIFDDDCVASRIVFLKMQIFFPFSALKYSEIDAVNSRCQVRIYQVYYES